MGILYICHSKMSIVMLWQIQHILCGRSVHGMLLMFFPDVFGIIEREVNVVRLVGEDVGEIGCQRLGHGYLILRVELRLQFGLHLSYHLHLIYDTVIQATIRHILVDDGARREHHCRSGQHQQTRLTSHFLELYILLLLFNATNTVIMASRQ